MDRNFIFKIAKTVFFTFFACIFIILIIYCVNDKIGAIPRDPLTYIENWTVTKGDGSSFEVERSHAAEERYDEPFTVEAKLPDTVLDNSFLCFETGKSIQVYINGELRKEFDEYLDVALNGGSVKRFYMVVPLTEEDAGAELRLERVPTKKRGQIVPETFVTTLGGLYFHMFEKYGPAFMMAEVVLLLSIVVILVSFGMRIWYRRENNMLYGAMSIFVSAAWVVTNSMMFPFIFGHYHIDGIINYMFCLLMPFAPAIYLNSLQRGRYRISMSVIMIISSINCVVWPVLHFTGIFSFSDALVYIILVLGFLSAWAVILLIKDIIHGHVKSYKYTAIGFIGFLLCGFYELFSLLFLRPKYEEIPMVIGLLFFLVFVVIQQVDEIRKTYAEKQHAIDISEAKTRFLASMSHEIRTPINAILGMNEMILRENKDSVINGYSKNIKSSGNMLLMLVNDVLDFSKIEAGKMEIVDAPFHMSELLYDVISLVGERASEKLLKLDYELTDEVPEGLTGDEFRIRQILINLLNNAVKYTDKGSVTLLVGGKYTGDVEYELHFTVKDTGRGIKSEDIPNLFTAFSRADIKENISIEGTGLGLAIVKRIVDSMDGNIDVKSVYQEGSEFTVTLPMKVCDKTPLTDDFMNRRDEMENQEEELYFTAPNASILAVDDNPSNLTIVKLFLKRNEIVPDLCSSGTEAIEKCKVKKYDLILLDHMMPKPDGMETLKAIREEEDSKNKTTSVVVLTANAVAGSRKIYLDAGFNDYLTKPIAVKALEQTVMKYLPEEMVYFPDVSDETETGKITDAEAEDDVVFAEFFPEEEEDSNPEEDLRTRLSAIEGLDYNTALLYSGGDESILREILQNMASECSGRCERMRKNLSEEDWDAYRIEAHSIKGQMATIGMNDLSKRAMKHEYAARDKEVAFILEDAQSFLSEYGDVCGRFL